MSSTELTHDLAARAGFDEGERELKFTLPGGCVHLARQWIERACRRDAEHPSAVVWTIYYDTPALDSLGEKINSDYLKRKIRVRWYSDLEGRPAGPAFVEAKMRVGTRRSKVRVRLPFPAEEVARWDLQDERLAGLPLLLRAQGIPIRDRWQALMLIRYRRDRFEEPASRSRVSLDSDIAGVAVNSSLLAPGDCSPIGTAVLEVKGAGEQLPRALQSLLVLGVRQRSFSKFLTVYARMSRQLL